MVGHWHFDINFDWLAFENQVNITRKSAVNSSPLDTEVDTLAQLALASFVNSDKFAGIKDDIGQGSQKQANEQAQETNQLKLASNYFTDDIKARNSILFLLLMNNINSYFLNL